MQNVGDSSRAERRDGYGTCGSCAQTFPYYLIHNGFNDTAYAYCDTCGLTAFLGTYAKRPDGVPYRPYEHISKDVEPFLRPCDCGGRFSATAFPRCPSCREPLSPTDAAAWIEPNAPGSARRWWQGTWEGLHAIVIDGRAIYDPWLWEPETPRAE
jgi:hypothetical protein